MNEYLPWITMVGFGVLVAGTEISFYRSKAAFDRVVAEHEAAIECEREEWRQAHPELAAAGVPPPPTPRSQTRYEWRGIA